MFQLRFSNLIQPFRTFKERCKLLRTTEMILSIWIRSLTLIISAWPLVTVMETIVFQKISGVQGLILAIPILVVLLFTVALLVSLLEDSIELCKVQINYREGLTQAQKMELLHSKSAFIAISTTLKLISYKIDHNFNHCSHIHS